MHVDFLHYTEEVILLFANRITTSKLQPQNPKFKGGLIIERLNTTNATPTHPTHPESGAFLSKRIGGTTYYVSVHFNPTSTETMQDKILRLVKNDLNLAPLCATMKLPQTGHLLEDQLLNVKP